MGQGSGRAGWDGGSGVQACLRMHVHCFCDWGRLPGESGASPGAKVCLALSVAG